MIDIEKVIKGLENCSVTNGNCRWKEHPDCPYLERCKAEDYSALNRDALELLKERQEGVKPFHKCIGKEYSLIENSHYDYCPYCGRKLLWNVL